MTPWQIERADVIEWLANYEGPRFHAVLSDPPYALISIAKRFGPGQAEAQHGSDGRFNRLSTGFMGQEWDGFESLAEYQEWVAEWSRLLIANALHPGALCMFFGGTRTWHRLACGLEDGGFKLYNTIMWVYGQGFPKSHDISKYLDKAAGAEKEANWEKSNQVTAPATPEAQTWDGWGTALKPAWEPVIVCRAPRDGNTYADLALRYGTGALNIDGSRGEGAGGGPRHNPLGRWPANFVLEHNPDCVKVGETTVEGRTLNRYPSKGAGGSFAFYAEDHRGDDYQSEQMADETVEVWACTPGCPVRVLDEMTSDPSKARSAKGGGTIRTPESEMTGIQFGNRQPGHQNVIYHDTGGASRFFYCAKASRSEKDYGLLGELGGEPWRWRRTDNGWARVGPDYQPEDGERIIEGNVHPTVKPIEMIRYLALLMLPPDLDSPRRILVPFAGSGSEMIGARQAEWDQVVGVEISDDYADIAEARLRANLGML